MISYIKIEMSNESKSEDLPPSELKFDAVDLMLEGNLIGQINYSIVKSVAAALDEKVQILLKAEKDFQAQEGETFTEAAMPEIEAMTHSVLYGCVDFSKIRFWEACETAEVAWEETKDGNGKVVQRMPYANSLEFPLPGNRILVNLEIINSWLESVHKKHEEKGMGWVSPYGCPEDGQQAYEKRKENLKKLSDQVASIKANFEL